MADTTAPPMMMTAAAADPAERIPLRRLVAFLIMVFGMFGTGSGTHRQARMDGLVPGGSTRF